MEQSKQDTKHTPTWTDGFGLQREQRPDGEEDHVCALIVENTAPRKIVCHVDFGYGSEHDQTHLDLMVAAPETKAQRDHLLRDQEDWREGVALIASSVGIKDSLCCVTINEAVLRTAAQRDELRDLLREVLAIGPHGPGLPSRRPDWTSRASAAIARATEGGAAC